MPASAAPGHDSNAPGLLVWVDDDHPLRQFFPGATPHSRLGVGLLVHDLAGVVVAANAEAVELLGASPAHVLGRGAADPRWAVVDQDGMPLAEAGHPVTLACGTGLPQVDRLVGIAVPDEVGAPRTRWLTTNVTPLRDPVTGDVVGATATLSDVTDDAVGRAATDRALSAWRSLAATRGVATIATHDGRITWASTEITETLGWLPDALVGGGFLQLLHPEDRPSAAERFAVGALRPWRARLRMADDGWRWVDLSADVQRDADGAVVGTVESVRDAQLAVRLQTEARLSEAELRALAENARAVVVRTSADGTLTFVSDTVASLLGRAPADMVGTSILSYLHDDDVGTTSAVFDGSRPPAGEHEARLSLAAGGWRWMRITVRELDLEDGVGTRVATLVDVHEQVAARQRLEQSEAHFRLLAENASDVVYLVDTSARCTWVSPSVTDVLGWEPADLVGRTMLDLVHRADLAPAEEARREALRDGRDRSVEVRYRAKDGSWRWMSVAGHIHTDADGAVLGGVTALRDVHALVEARRRLEASERRYRDLAEHSLDVVVRLTADGGIGWVSPSVSRVLGWSAEEFARRHAADLIHPDDREQVLAGRQRSADTGDVSRVDCRILRGDGSWEWMAGEGLVLPDPDHGHPTAMVSLRSIAGEKAADAAVRDARERLQLVLDSSGLGLWDWNMQTDEIVVNDRWAEMIGYTVAELAPVSLRTWDRLAHPDDLAASRTLIAEHDRTGSAFYELELRIRHRDGHWVWVRDRGRIVARSAEGRALRMTGTREDVSAMRAARLELESSEERYRLLAETVNDVVEEFDAGWHLVWASPSLRTVLGYDAHDAVGSFAPAMIHPDDDLPSEREAIDAVIAARGSGHSRRVRRQHADGTWRWVDSTLSFRYDAVGALAATYITSRDVNAEVLAEQALEASRERFQRMFTNHDAVMLLVDPDDGLIVDANEAASEFYGHSRDVLRAMRISQINALGEEEVRDQIQNAAEQTRNSFVFPHRLADGTVRTVEVHTSPIHDGDRMLLFSIVRDITDDLAARDALRESRRLYRALAENSGDVVLLLSGDGHITWASPAVTRLTAWAPDELLGRATFDLAHPDDLPQVQAGRLEVLAGGTAHFETRVLRGDGRWQWIHVVSRAMTGDDGVVTGIVTNWRDATAEVAARQALQASERRFRLAMSTAPIPMMLLDLDRRVTDTNEALTVMLGYRPEELASLGLTDLLDDGEQALSELSLADLASGALDVATTERAFRTREGAMRWGRLSVSLVRDDADLPSHYIAQLMDLTEVKDAQEQLTWRALHDSLTGLPNRAAFTLELERAKERARGHDTPLAVLFCDLDGFKQINDTHGHDAGDHVLKQVAVRLTGARRDADTVARLGGDEFVVIAETIGVPDGAVALAERLLAQVREPVVLPDGATVTPAMSVGIAVAGHGESRRDILRRADNALYDAKDAGKNRWAMQG